MIRQSYHYNRQYSIFKVPTFSTVQIHSSLVIFAIHSIMCYAMYADFVCCIATAPPSGSGAFLLVAVQRTFSRLRSLSAYTLVTLYFLHSPTQLSVPLSPLYQIQSSQLKHVRSASPVQWSKQSTLFAQWLQTQQPHGVVYLLLSICLGISPSSSSVIW